MDSRSLKFSVSSLRLPCSHLFPARQNLLIPPSPMCWDNYKVRLSLPRHCCPREFESVGSCKDMESTTSVTQSFADNPSAKGPTQHDKKLNRREPSADPECGEFPVTDASSEFVSINSIVSIKKCLFCFLDSHETVRRPRRDDSGRLPAQRNKSHISTITQCPDA